MDMIFLVPIMRLDSTYRYILLAKREGRTGRILARGLDQGSIFSQRFITRLKLFRRKTQMIDCKDTINFKCAIFIYSKLNDYSRLKFSKRRKTKLEENKNNILHVCGVNTFRKKQK